MHHKFHDEFKNSSRVWSIASIYLFVLRCANFACFYNIVCLGKRFSLGLKSEHGLRNKRNICLVKSQVLNLCWKEINVKATFINTSKFTDFFLHLLIFTFFRIILTGIEREITQITVFIQLLLTFIYRKSDFFLQALCQWFSSWWPWTEKSTC